MSVLIKGMDMPRSCANCEWSSLSKMDLGMSMYCKLTKKTGNLEVAKNYRVEFCPLVEVPTPHGRLIDAEKLKDTIRANHYPLIDFINSHDMGMFTCGIMQAIDEQPTADVRENKRGEWIEHETELEEFFECSVCKLTGQRGGTMTREEIIKALEVCDCNETGEKCHLCPMNHGFGAWENGETCCYRRLMQHARKLLIADLKKKEPGEWIKVDCGLVDGYKCSKCGNDAPVIRERTVLFDFCPFCGNPKRKIEEGEKMSLKMEEK